MHTPETHIDEEVLEQYALHMAAGSTDSIEQHLLVCESCRRRLEFLIAWGKSVRRALDDESGN